MTEAQAAPATNGSSISPEDFYLIKEAHDPRISPDGRTVAYVLQEVDRAANTYAYSIWLIGTNGRRHRRFTAGGRAGDFSPRWSPDGRTLAFLSGRAGKSQVFVIDLHGGEARQLTTASQGVAGFTWAPDGNSIAYISRVNDEERRAEDKPQRRKSSPPDGELEKIKNQERELLEQRKTDPRVIERMVFRNGTVFRDGRRSHIYVQSTRKGPAARITSGDYDFALPAWTPDGNFLVTAANRTGDEDSTTRSDILKIDVKEKTLVSLVDDGSGNGGPQVSPDGKWIAYVCFNKDRIWEQRTTLRLIPVDGGEPRDLTMAAGLDIESFAFSPDSAWIYFVTPRMGSNDICRVQITAGEIQDVATGRRMIEGFTIARKTGQIAFEFQSPAVPGDIACAAADGSGERRLTDINRAFFRKHSLSLPELIWIDRPDGARVQGWFMKPAGYEAGKRYPWALEIHGGPHIMWGWSWWHEFQCIAARGYGVYFSNPRGSQGYGYAFKGAIHRNWGGDDMADLLAGMDKMVEMGLADPDRLVVTGGSFGGFMTSWMISHDHRFKAAVAQRGVYNLISLYGNSDALLLVDWEFDTEPWGDTQRLWQNSPLSRVKYIQTPLLILHSEQDFRAGIHTAEELFVALRKLGKTAQFVRYPREGHELSRSGEPRHRIDRLNRIIGWFDKFVPDKSPV